MEMILKSKNLSLPSDICSNQFLSQFFDLCKDDSNTDVHTAPTEPIAVPEKRKKVVAVVKASRSRAPTVKAHLDSARSRSSSELSMKSRNSLDSALGKSLMEVDDTPLSGDPLMSTTSYQVATISPFQASSSTTKPKTARSTKLLSNDYGDDDDDDIPVFVLEEKAEIPENEMAKFGFAPSLVLKQTKKKANTMKAIHSVAPLPSIPVNELEALFKL